MRASGVFKSWETLDTKFDLSSARRTSRAAARATKKTPSAITPASIAKPIEWRGGNELETSGAELLEQRTQRCAVAGGQVFEVREGPC